MDINEERSPLEPESVPTAEAEPEAAASTDVPAAAEATDQTVPEPEVTPAEEAPAQVESQPEAAPEADAAQPEDTAQAPSGEVTDKTITFTDEESKAVFAKLIAEMPESSEELTQILEAIPDSDEALTQLAGELPESSEELSHLIEDLPESDKELTKLIASLSAIDSPEEAPAEESDAENNSEADTPSDASSQTDEKSTRPILFGRNKQMLEMKKKQVVGPEKRYYDLSEQGVMKLQLGMILNLVILALSVAATTLYTLDILHDNRLKLLIFSQILAMLGSGFLGSQLLVDGIDDLFHLRFTTNTILAATFAACCADAVFCVQELRIPCCAAFSLEMSMAMLARYHKRTTEIAQLDTMRKAVKLISLVREPNYYEGRTAIVRGEGDVDDFMETYQTPSRPEKNQNLFCGIAFLVCLGIAALAGILHGVSMGVQIFAISLLAAVPASAFVALTRPMALLEKRLHMVGAVICGWQGVKKLCAKSLFPLTDNDLFPKGATKLNGIKFYAERNPDDVVSYTASLISTAGGGLVNVFHNLMQNRNCKEYPVDNFRDYGSGGIGGDVCGEPVLVGTLQFLQDMGVDIPQGTTVSQAVYVAVDGQLAAVAAISYAKMRSAAAGMVSLIGCPATKPLLLAGDFMLTEDFIKNKFSVNSRKLITPSKEERKTLSQITADPEADVLALATRDDLISAVYAVTGANALRTASIVGLLVQVVSSILGMVIMAALAYIGATDVLTPTNVFLYQLVWMIPGFLATEWTRHI